MVKDDLNTNQKRFVDLYLATNNATASYKKIYKSKNDNIAAAAATRMLGNVKVQDYINKKRMQIEEKFNLTIEKIQKEVYDLIHDPKAQRIEKLKGHDILLKTLGAYTHNVNATISPPIIVDDVPRDDYDAD